MYFSLLGIITYIAKDFIVLEVNNIGYQLYVSKSQNYKLNEKSKLYLYHHLREEEEYFVGLSSLEEKEVFLSLISVKGIGPKTALNMLGVSSPKTLISAIAANNVAYLKRLPGIGSKQASQILLDLKGIYVSATANISQYDEVKQALRNMGFKSARIDLILSEINIENASNETILREALRRLK